MIRKSTKERWFVLLLKLTMETLQPSVNYFYEVKLGNNISGT